jgi:kynurenine formamidase
LVSQLNLKDVLSSYWRNNSIKIPAWSSTASVQGLVGFLFTRRLPPNRLNEGLAVKKVIDLSVPMKSQETPVYPGYPMPLRATFTTIRDDGYLSHIWTFAEHSGTHVDAPGHFVSGAHAIDQVPISRFVSKGVVLDFSKKKPRFPIGKGELSRALEAAGKHKVVGPGWAILFYTGYTSKAFTADWMEHPELDEAACRSIAVKRVNAIGFDAPSPDHSPFPAHKILLAKGIVIYETLANLEKLLRREFILVGTPLGLVGGSASPCRPVALVL